MKIIKRVTETYEYDTEKELERLHKCFEGDQLQRQLDIFNAVFKEKDLKKASNLINALPRCEERECSETEYIGLWTAIFSMDSWGAIPEETDITYEYE